MPQTKVDYCFYEDALPEWDILRILLAEDDTGAVFFPLRTLCDALKIDRPTQAALIQTDSRTRPGARTIKAPTRGGPQESLYLRRRECAIWLAGLDPSKVGGRAKGQLEKFQDALWMIAERTGFRRKIAREANAEDIGEVVTLTAELRGEFLCECGRRHVIEMRDGELRVYQ